VRANCPLSPQPQLSAPRIPQERRKQMLTRNLILVAGAVTLLAACGSDATGPIRTVEGTFTLTTVNGAVLPFTLVEDDEDNRVELVSGAIVTTVDRTFTDVMSFLIVEDGEETTDTEELDGTYTLSGNTISFTVSGGVGGYTAQLNESAGTITQNISGLTLVYTSQPAQ
jgi:hypothetical protein